MNDTDVSWLAGLLEGEGYFRTHTSPGSRRAQLRLEVQMCDRDVIERVHFVTQANGTVRRYVGRGNRQPTYRVLLSGQQAEDVMRAVLPYMGERRAARIRECLAQNLSHHPKIKEAA